MGIQGHASLIAMRMTREDPNYQHLKGIEEMVQRGSELTRQLLGFARAGRYDVRPSDLNEIMSKSARMFGRTKKEIVIRERYEKNLWPVEVDRGQIEQVLLNLYVNAWQAMPGGGELYLQTQNVTLDQAYVGALKVKPGKYVKVSITDTGIGMDKQTQKRIFEPFFTTKEMGRGTGLGLASVYGIIKNHGGLIDVLSEKGRGTTFTIHLPASQKDTVKEKEPSAQVLRGNETILLVDDEEVVLDVCSDILRSMGYHVLTARSGAEALRIYEKNRDKTDLVILDMIMPGASGRETYDRLKRINPKVKVLLASGYSMNGQAKEIMARGCDGFIQKPFTPKEISRRIREILDVKQSLITH